MVSTGRNMLLPIIVIKYIYWNTVLFTKYHFPSEIFHVQFITQPVTSHLALDLTLCLFLYNNKLKKFLRL